MSIEILRGRIAQGFDTARVLSLHHLRKFLRCRKSEIPRKKQIEWKISLFERSILGNFCDNDRQKYFTKIYAIIINKGKRRLIRKFDFAKFLRKRISILSLSLFYKNFWDNRKNKRIKSNNKRSTRKFLRNLTQKNLNSIIISLFYKNFWDNGKNERIKSNNKYCSTRKFDFAKTTMTRKSGMEEVEYIITRKKNQGYSETNIDPLFPQSHENS